MKGLISDMSQMDRKTLLKRAGIGAGALTLPALFGAEAALAAAPPNSRIATWIVISHKTYTPPATTPPPPAVFPTIAWTGEVAFRPEQRFIKGGGHFTIVDWNKPPAQRIPPLATGAWKATEFLGWTTTGLPPVGQIQPGVLDAKIEMDGLGAATMRFACNVGFVGLQTGQPETVVLTNVPQYETFGTPFQANTAASLTSSTIPGYPNVPVTA